MRYYIKNVYRHTSKPWAKQAIPTKATIRIEVNVVCMTTVDEFELRGDEPIEQAQKFLETYDNSDYSAVKVTLTRKSSDQTQSTATNKTVSDFSSKRQKGDIREGTSHEAVLRTVADLTQNGDYVPGREIQELDINSVSKSSVFPALTQLWERKMLDRKRGEGGSYAYKISDYGKKKIAEIEEAGE